MQTAGNLFQRTALGWRQVRPSGKLDHTFRLAMTKAYPSFIVDAFSAKPFGGNPAAVCLVDDALSDESMLAIAREFGLSETAFVVPRGDAFHLRWFTPSAEVALCGHATLAGAAVLWATETVASDRVITFRTLSGPLTASRAADAIAIELPRMELIPTRLPEETAAALGIHATDAFRTPNRGGIEDFDYLVPLPSEHDVRALMPDERALTRTPAGVIVTARAETAPFDFVSRYFAPFWGIPEDPVTGGAHCALAPYWADRLGRTHLRAYQASRRGGALDVELLETTVRLTGQATIVLRGELTL